MSQHLHATTRGVREYACASFSSTVCGTRSVHYCFRLRKHHTSPVARAIRAREPPRAARSRPWFTGRPWRRASGTPGVQTCWASALALPPRAPGPFDVPRPPRVLAPGAREAARPPCVWLRAEKGDRAASPARSCMWHAAHRASCRQSAPASGASLCRGWRRRLEHARRRRWCPPFAHCARTLRRLLRHTSA